MEYKLRIEKDHGIVKYVRAIFPSSVLTLSLENVKTSGETSSIASFSLPPITTCKPNAPCACKNGGCYAVKMARIHPSCMVGWKNNLSAILSPEWIPAMVAMIVKSNVEYVRVHVSGDFFSAAYVQAWQTIASALPSVKFLAFSKRDDMDLSGFPSNFRIVASDWFSTPCEIPNVPHSIVGKHGERPINAIPCTGKCYECFACWNLTPDQAVYFELH